MSSDRPTSGRAPGYGEYGPLPDPPVRAAEPPASAPPPAGPTRAATGPRDLPVTIGLLVVGALTAMQAIAAAPLFSDAIGGAFAQQGIDGYAPTRADAVGGPILAVVSVVALLVAVWATVVLRRRSRRTFWVPLVCGAFVVLTNIVVAAVVILANPAMSELLALRGV